MKRNICIIVNGYPTKDDPIYAFIRPVALELADLGYHITIIAPQSITQIIFLHKKRREYHWIDKSSNGNLVDVYQPKFISFSKFRPFNINLNVFFRDIAIKRCYKKNDFRNDILYGHFWDCGICAGQIAKQHNIPVFVVSGESNIRVFDYYSQDIIDKYLDSVKGVICVSTKNLNESKKLGLLKHNPRKVVLPNAVDPEKFFIMSKEIAREKLGYNNNDKIAIFVGAFNNRKGVMRVVKAAEAVDGLKLVLIGSGEECPNSEQIIFSGKVPHDELVVYLNAADVFVLPTTAEGCCNAIVEALACGKPIISSDLSFNDDILNDNNSLRIDSTNISQISDALNLLFKDLELRVKMEEGSRETGEELTIHKRVKKIVEFIEYDN